MSVVFHTQDTKDKIAQSNRGKKHSTETKLKMSVSALARKQNTELRVASQIKRRESEYADRLNKIAQDGGMTCVVCKLFFSMEKFRRDQRKKLGYARICRTCAAAQTKRHHAANREKINEQSRIYKSRPEVRARIRLQVQSAPEKSRAATKAWAAKNKTRVADYSKKYASRPEVKMRNRERASDYRKTDKYKAYKLSRKEIERKQAKAYSAKRRATIAGCLNNRVSRSINACLRDGKKRKKVFEILGYTSSELANHLERQFTKGMTWDIFRQGKIHIDHILPVSFFSFKDVNDPELLRCWSLANLRPMWAVANMKKGNRRITLL